jgi:hypothetical protein
MKHTSWSRVSAVPPTPLIGQIVQLTCNTDCFIVSAVHNNLYTLINIVTGTRWTNPQAQLCWDLLTYNYEIEHIWPNITAYFNDTMGK